MITSLTDIKIHLPDDKFQVLLESLGKDEADSQDLTMQSILSAVGIKWAMRILKVFPFSNHGLLIVRLCQDILPLYENDNASDAPRNAILAMSQRAKGEISAAQLKSFSDLALEPAQNASTEISSTAAWAIYFASQKQISAAIDAITATRAHSGILESDIPNQSADRAWLEVENRLTDRLNDVVL
jgi:hypothetical protein